MPELQAQLHNYSSRWTLYNLDLFYSCKCVLSLQSEKQDPAGLPTARGWAFGALWVMLNLLHKMAPGA